MAETEDGSLRRRAALAACLTLMFAVRGSAQQPTFTPAPAAPEFLSRYDFRLSVDSLMPPKNTPEELADERFSWNTRFGGSFDVLDLVFARAGATIDFEAVEGSEYRPFDPNQGNYILEGFVLARAGEHTEVGAIFHHVSRHLSDRAKARLPVAYNELGIRLLRRDDFGAVFLSHDLVVPGALDGADFLILELLPGLERGLLDRQHIDAGGIVTRIDDADRLSPLLRHVHGSEHQVDLALLQELHAVRRHDRLQFEPDAELAGHVSGEIGLETHDGAIRVAEAERLVVGFGAHDQNAALLDLVERLSRQRIGCDHEGGEGRDSGNDQLQHRSLRSDRSRFNETRRPIL